MEFSYYQTQSRKTAIYNTDKYRAIYPALGLCGEAGEVAEKIKKVIRDGTSTDEEWITELRKELGDVLWYLNQVASDVGISLEDVAKENLEKLNSRMKRGVLKGSGDNR